MKLQTRKRKGFVNPMPSDSEVPFYFGEVIGSALSYHRPSCHIVEQIRRRNYKRLRNWEEAVSLGLHPCPHCRPPFLRKPQPRKEPAPQEAQPNQLTSSQLADLRRGLLRLLDELGPSLPDEN